MAENNRYMTGTKLLQKALGKKKRAESALQGVGRKIGKKVRTVVKNRIEVQKNFERRANNSNYYRSASSFKSRR
jgi:hypothetical protein